MFIGEFRHNLDSKKRVIIPAKFREELGELFIVTRGLDGCLTVYTMEQWTLLLEQLKKLPSTKKETRLYVRSITSKATECECDAQGRIQLPSYLISEAAIEKECVIVGVADHVEIWSETRWEGYQEGSESFEDVAEQLTDFLL
ncbi:division/cell wall cluster transcriptional repressor MraZ [Anaerorhabdus sp.]|uniref:division/cell wall cluster transcriptional repressor MraZ n=1 Tax=Anaerorhabdus sp. TaxID=1872524 RepID=UPI002FCB4897